MHRDIKPENIMILKSGAVQVLLGKNPREEFGDQ